MKRFLGFLATILMVVLSTAPALAATPPTIKLPSSYTDAGLWASGGPQALASTAISDASLWGIINGYDNGSFQPQGNITRAEFAKMLAVAMGDASPDPAQMGNLTATETIFSDIPAQSWYAPYVQTLSANPGGNPSANVLTTAMYPGRALGPGQPITRAEAAAWISAGLQYFGVPASGQLTVGSSGLATANGSVYAVVPVTALQAASQAGTIKGFPDGTFQPDGLITRAQAAEMLTRFVAALPGYSALQRQTPYIRAMAGAYCDYINGHAITLAGVVFGSSKNCGSEDNAANGYPYGQPATILTSADLGSFTPASTESAFTAESVATWQQIHLWLATQNWLALGEAKLSQAEAAYVAGYGLQPYAVAEIAVVAAQYIDAAKDSPLLVALQPNSLTGGDGTFNGIFTPVSSVQLNCPDAPWDGGSPALDKIDGPTTLQFFVNGSGGLFQGNVNYQDGKIVSIQHWN